MYCINNYMVKKAIFLILAGYLISIIHSCCIEDYNGQWKRFKIQIIDNSGKEPIIWDGNSIINKKALGFRISMEDTVFRTAQNFNVITECQATSCRKRIHRLHAMTSIVIKSLYDYSDIIPAGSDITSLFKARIDKNKNEDYASISDIISFVNDPNNSYYKIFDLYLMDNKCKGGLQKFEIRIFLSNGDIFVKQTDDILLE